jgi:hypothetical protein
VITQEIRALAKDRQDELSQALAENFFSSGAHPALAATLRDRKWWHPMVRAKMLNFYASGAYGPDWDKPTPEDVLGVAARS